MSAKPRTKRGKGNPKDKNCPDKKAKEVQSEPAEVEVAPADPEAETKESSTSAPTVSESEDAEVETEAPESEDEEESLIVAPTAEEIDSYANSAALTTSSLDGVEVLPPSPRPSVEIIKPAKYRGENTPLGAYARQIRNINGPIDGFCAITIDPRTVFEVELERGLGWVPQRVADTIQSDGGPWVLL